MKHRIFTLLLAASMLTVLTACGGNGGKDDGGAGQTPVDLAAFAQTVMENHEFSGFVERADPTDEEFGGVMLDNYYAGLREMDLEQLEAYLCMVSMNTGELVLVQAGNEDDAAKAEEILQARIDSMTDPAAMNYPETVELWTGSAKVVRSGSYVMLVCHEDCDAIVEEFNALF